MNRMTLTVIGGGSVNWMRGLMRDVYLIDEIDGGEIRLVDPNAEHTEAVAEMLHAFNRMKGKSFDISITADRTRGLEGADFVLTTFSPGSMDAFWNDLELPIKYGVRLPVSMTVGPSGISASLRAVPEAYELVREMEARCPNAWLLNVTNPMSTVTRAMNMAAKTVKVAGLCHEFHAFPRYIGPMLGLHQPQNMDILDYLYRWLPEQGFDYTIAGINHFIWLTKASLNGEDMIPKIRQYCFEHNEIRPEESGVQAQATSSYRNKDAAKLALCRQFGYLPIVGDRHLVEFFPGLCNVRNGYGMKYGVVKTTVDSRRLEKVRQLEQIRSIASGKASVSWTRTGEEMTEIMKAVVSRGKVTAIVNAPNRGQISNLPEDTIVETLAEITEHGLEPRPAGALPGSIASITRLHADVQELTVRAALEGSRELLVEAFSLDPAGGNADFGELPELANELIRANRQWLPRFYA